MLEVDSIYKDPGLVFPGQWQLEILSMSEQEVVDEYMSSLRDLNLNSKPLINMLTMLAEDGIQHAPAIVQAVERHLQQVEL